MTDWVANLRNYWSKRWLTVWIIDSLTCFLSSCPLWVLLSVLFVLYWSAKWQCWVNNEMTGWLLSYPSSFILPFSCIYEPSFLRVYINDWLVPFLLLYNFPSFLISFLPPFPPPFPTSLIPSFLPPSTLPYTLPFLLPSFRTCFLPFIIHQPLVQFTI